MICGRGRDGVALAQEPRGSNHAADGGRIMREKIVRGVLACAVAALLGGCGAPEKIGEQSSALTSDITGIPGCPGTWQLAETWEGFVGQYLRTNLIGLTNGDLMTLGIFTATLEPESIRFTGSYLGSFFGTAAQGGTYVALESNPLIGSLIVLTPATPLLAQTVYAAIGIRRNAFGNIAAVCLSGAEHDGMPFVIDRVGL
jgi:hypothetical protein